MCGDDFILDSCFRRNDKGWGKMEIIKDVPKLEARKVDAHKGDFGKVCIIAGSVGMAGAAAIAGRSALRAGAGLVRVATPGCVLSTVAAIEPCFTTIALDDENGQMSTAAIGKVLDLASENDVVAFGPGVGVGAGPMAIVEKLIEQKGLRLIVDADGLNNLAKIKSWQTKVKADLILTPHPGEMQRLWRGTLRDDMPGDRGEQAVLMAGCAKATVVLKGAFTVVSNGEKLYVNQTGNPGMATAGSGDVLTGIIAALCGQGLDNFDAAVLGAYIHGTAGDIAAEKIGQVSMIATDIIDCLGEAFERN